MLYEHYRTSKLVYGDYALQRTAVYDSYNDFKSGQVLLHNEPHSGRPSTSTNAETIAEVKVLMDASQWITIRDVVNEVSISYESA